MGEGIYASNAVVGWDEAEERENVRRRGDFKVNRLTGVTPVGLQC